MTEQEQNLFVTFVLSIVRDNGGRYFIPAEKLAQGDFTMQWEKTAAGITVVETTPQLVAVTAVPLSKLGLAQDAVNARKKSTPNAALRRKRRSGR
jgi:hypothetical protein